MKRMIYQVKVGSNPPAFYDTCIDSVRQYCKKYGIEHIVQTEPILKIRPVRSKRSVNAVERLGYLPIFEKENAFSYLGDYNQIAVIDSDIYIMPSAPNIFDELHLDTDFAGVIEQSLPCTAKYRTKIENYSRSQYSTIHMPGWKTSGRGYEFYNMGLMLFNTKIKKFLAGQTPEQFIKRNEFEKFVNGEGNWRWSTDQTLLNYWVRTTGMKLQNLDWRWNALFKAIDDESLKEAHFIHFFLSNNLPQKGDEIPWIVENLDRVKEINYGHR